MILFRQRHTFFAVFAHAKALLIHGTNDLIVPYWNSVLLHQAAPENSVRIPIEGGDHFSL